jgi:hypothetical protein
VGDGEAFVGDVFAVKIHLDFVLAIFGAGGEVGRRWRARS